MVKLLFAAQMIVVFSNFFSTFFCIFVFYHSTIHKWFFLVSVSCLTLLYTLPFPNQKNARNWLHKIYVVVSYVVGVTLFLPVTISGGALLMDCTSMRYKVLYTNFVSTHF
jgi:hypothetical protein